MSTSVSDLHLSKPIVRRKMVKAENRASLRTTVNCQEYGELVFDEPVAHGGTGEGPSPLQGVLAALCGCASVTFNRTAKETEFKYSKLSFAAEYTIDIRGRLGVRGVVPHFKTVRVDIEVETEESTELLQTLVEETEARCPVYNLLKDANVNILCNWVNKNSKRSKND
jgi:uncharacterized OsmC-like protein